jgi:hypothetical protein
MSKFTEGSMETGGKPGSSNDVVVTKMPGGTINTGYAMDNVHGVNVPNCMGKSMGGGETSLVHSLSGASAVQRTTRNRG